MATLITDVINLPELTGYVRESAVLQGPTLASVLPPTEVDDIEFELQNMEAPTFQVARYRAWDTPPPLGNRPGITTIRGEIAPLGMSLTLNEREIKRFNLLKAGLPGGSADDIYDDAFQCAMAAQTRIERARADLLTDGKVTINENGFTLEADFGVPGGHFITPATAWSTTATSVPITDLKAAQTTYRAANGGRNPDAWLISSEVAADLTLNAQIRNLMPVTGIVPGLITDVGVAQVMRTQGIAPFVVFDGVVPNASTNVAEPTLGTRKVVAVRRGMGDVLYGITPSAELMAGNGVIRRREAAGIIAYVEEEIRPARVITTAEAVALPVLRDPKALMVLSV